MKKQTRWYGRDWDYGIGTGDYHVYSFPSEESMRYWLGPDSDLTRSAGDETDAHRARRIEDWLADEKLKARNCGYPLSDRVYQLIDMVERANALDQLKSGKSTDVDVDSGYYLLPGNWDEYRAGWADDDPAKAIEPQGEVMMVTVPDGKVIVWYDEDDFLNGGEGTLLTPEEDD